MALSASAIIQQLQQGQKSDQIKANTSWAALSSQDRTALVEQADKWKLEDAGFELLRLLYGLAPETEFGFRIKTLARVIIRDNVKTDKVRLLNTIKSEMDKWRTALSASRDPGQVKEFKIYEMDYIWLNGFVFEEKEQYAQAQDRYQAALDGYRTIGHQPGVLRATQKLEAVKNRKPDDLGAIPLDVLQSRRSALETDIARFTANLLSLQNQIAAKQQESAVQAKKLDDLHKQNIPRAIEAKALQSELEKLTSTRKIKTEEIASLESGLQFLMALPQAAVAPLWVEVIRMALKKGQFDAFTIEALKRLAITSPETAIPLLAEIAARSPQPFMVDASQITTKITLWFSQLTEARKLQDTNKLESARIMVQAWDNFLALPEGETVLD